jgi:hypothetical protein
MIGNSIYQFPLPDYVKDDSTIHTLTTGALKSAKVNNIYDMAGNMFEWTMEGFTTESRVMRGGFCILSGAALSVAFRYYGFDPAFNVYCVSFRPALYIKK